MNFTPICPTFHVKNITSKNISNFLKTMILVVFYIKTLFDISLLTKLSTIIMFFIFEPLIFTYMFNLSCKKATSFQI